MYSYTFDCETNGILFDKRVTALSLEARPVFASELDMYGIDKFYSYPKDDKAPLMWAESVNYFYKGKKVFKLKGGALYTAPELIMLQDENGKDVLKQGSTLEYTNLELMCKKNKEIQDLIEDKTIKGIQRIYDKYRKKLDIFEVAYSGGKDSLVLFDLVYRSLPLKSYVVIFGDTGMEFPDTYEHIDKIENYCKENDIPFYRAKSHLTPSESWEKFGPPARRLRWCCSVHKSTPQTLKMRELTGKKDYQGLDFVGVRKHESIARSTYEKENYGKKQKGQYSYNAILEWTSAEVWNYIFYHNLDFNTAYKKGNTRAGCLMCPMSGGCGDFVRYYCYKKEIDKYKDFIKRKCLFDTKDEANLKKYFDTGAWCSRCSGKTLKDNPIKYKEEKDNGLFIFTLINPKQDYKEWLKPIGNLGFKIAEEVEGNQIILKVKEDDLNKDSRKAKFFKLALHKAAYCIECRVCEQNCAFGCLTFKNSKVQITNCKHCMNCFGIGQGCLAYSSLSYGKGDIRKMTIDTFNAHAIKENWLSSFFNSKENFIKDNDLGPNMLTYFKVFLKGAGLINKSKEFNLTDFAHNVPSNSWNSITCLTLMLINLAYNNAQFEWMIKDMNINYSYSLDEIEGILKNLEVSDRSCGFIKTSLGRISQTSFGKKGLKFITADNDNKSKFYTRNKIRIENPYVFLYALCVFSQKINLTDFSLSYLFDETIERAAVSPIRIFGLEKDEVKELLIFLSNDKNASDFIYASFTHDLDKIVIRNNNSEECLKLFK